jgi:hypothetical protein
MSRQIATVTMEGTRKNGDYVKNGRTTLKRV